MFFYFSFCFSWYSCIASSAVAKRNYVLTAVIKNSKSIIKKKKKIVLITKNKLNTVVLISKVSMNSNISHHELVLINNVLKEYDMKDGIKNSNDK